MSIHLHSSVALSILTLSGVLGTCAASCAAAPTGARAARWAAESAGTAAFGAAGAAPIGGAAQSGSGGGVTPSGGSAGAVALPDGPGPVGRHGALRVAGNRIVDASGEPLQLRGMSLFWSQWSQYYAPGTV